MLKNFQFLSWRNLFITAFIAAAIFLIIQNISLNRGQSDNPYKDAKIEIKVFKNDFVSQEKDSGFGYEIYVFDALYIHQLHIPGVPGTQGFETEEDAQKTAKLVVEKIHNNIIPPSISVEELKNLGVLD